MWRFPMYSVFKFTKSIWRQKTQWVSVLERPDRLGGGEGGMLEGQATPMGDAPSRSPLWGSAASNRTTGPISLWPKEADRSIWKLFQRFGIPNSCFWKEVSKKKKTTTTEKLLMVWKVRQILKLARYYFKWIFWYSHKSCSY